MTNESRSRRGLARRTRRRAVALLGIVVAVALLAWAVATLTSGSGPSSGTLGAGGGGGPPSRLTLFGISADPAFAAVVGTGGGRPAAAVVVPSDTLTAMPVEGSGTVAEAMGISPERGRVATANMLGAWIQHYAVLDLKGLTTVVDRRGGLIVNLPPGVSLEGQVLGPGPTKLTGQQVVTYLNAAKGSERTLRWKEVLGPMLAGPLDLDEHQAQMDDAGAVRSSLSQAGGAAVAEVPTVPSEGGLLQPNDPAIKKMLAQMFGYPDREPVEVIVLNGTPHNRAAELITGSLVPAGYRIAAFGDARGEHHKTTLIVTAVEAAVPEANRILKVLKVGKVFLGGEGSGIADITVIVGKDYLRA